MGHIDDAMKQAQFYPGLDEPLLTTPLGRAEATTLSPCSLACPLGINVQRYVGQAQRGMLVEALETILEQCPLPGVCGFICQRPCEASCRRGNFGRPVAIRWLKKAAVGAALAAGLGGRALQSATAQRAATGYGVAIIGAGPAGLAAAWSLARLGHGVVLFDKAEVAGGLLAEVVPEERLPSRVLRADVERILEHPAITFRGGVELGRDGDALAEVRALAGEEHRFAAVLLATGARRLGEMKLGETIAPESAEGVANIFEVLRERGRGAPKPEKGQRAIVIGGSTPSVAAARALRRAGWSSVTLVSPWSIERWPADREDLDAAREEGVAFTGDFRVEGVVLGQGRVRAISGRRVKIEGLGAPRSVDAELEQLETDLVVAGPSRDPSTNGVAHTAGVRLTMTGAVAVDVNSLQTGRAGFFAAGECTTGPKTVVEALAAGKRAARSIDRFIRGESLDERGESRSRAWSDHVVADDISIDDTPSPWSLGEPLEVPPSKAAKEAGRCLRCGPCTECERCDPACHHERVVNPEKGSIFRAPAGRASDGDVLMARVDEQRCTGCGRCEEACPHQAVVVRFRAVGAPLAMVRRPACRGCGRCAAVCPFEAIDLNPGRHDLPSLWQSIGPQARLS